MYSFIMLAYEVLCALVPFGLVLLALKSARRRQGLRFSGGQYAALLILAVYIMAVFHVTGTGTLYDGLRYQLEMRPEQINLIPFVRDIDPVGYVLNIILFVPLGLLAPLIWRRQNFISILGAGLGFSLLIELSQLLNNRSTDIDDLLMNTLGTVVGFVIYKLLVVIMKPKISVQAKTQAAPGAELWLYIGAMFAGHFLLFNEMGIAQLLYGF